MAQSSRNSGIFSFEISANNTYHLQNTTFGNLTAKLTVLGSRPVQYNFPSMCFPEVGTFELQASFGNALTNTTRLTFYTTVQNAIEGLEHNISGCMSSVCYLKVNSSIAIEIEVSQGTNLTCVWTFSNGFESRDTPYLAQNVTEGINSSRMFHFRERGNIAITYTVFNYVSRSSKTLDIRVQQWIIGLNVSLCFDPLTHAYKDALTCFRVTTKEGDALRFGWDFGDSNSEDKEDRALGHVYRQTGDFSVVVTGYNKISLEVKEINIIVVPSPLSMQAPTIVAANTNVRVFCNLTWPYDSANNFYQRFNLSGQPGTDVPSAPLLQINFGDGQSAKVNSTVGYLDHRYSRKIDTPYKPSCRVDGFPSLNVHQPIEIWSINSVQGVSITTNCGLQILVGQTCVFTAAVVSGDKLSFRWAVTDSKTISSKASFSYVFLYNGSVTVSLNVSNEVSSLEGNRRVSVLLLHPETKSLYLSVITSSYSMFARTAMIIPMSSIPSTKETISSSKTVFSSDVLRHFSRSRVDSSLSTVRSTVALYSTVTQAKLIATVTLQDFRSATERLPSLESPFKTIASLGTLVVSQALPRIIESYITSSSEVVLPAVSPQLIFPKYGIADQELEFIVLNVLESQFHFLWSWGDGSSSEQRPSLTHHKFSTPGSYHVTVKVYNSSYHVILAGHVVIQDNLVDIRVKEISSLGEGYMCLEFTVYSGGNVTYLVSFGDGSGKKH